MRSSAVDRSAGWPEFLLSKLRNHGQMEEESDVPPGDHAVDPRLAFDDEGTVVEANRAAESVFGADEGELIGEPIGEVFPPSEAGAIGAALNDDLERLPSSVAVERDGRWVEFYLFARSDGVEALGQRRSDEGLLRDELRRKRDVLEALPVPVYHLDEYGMTQYINPAYARLLDTDRERMGGHAGQVLRPEDLERGIELLREMLSEDPTTGNYRTFEQVSYSATGRRIVCENRMALLMDDGEFVGNTGVVLEVGDRKRERKRIEVLERVLRHNLRTRLGLIEGHVEAIREATDPPEENVEAITTSIDELLSFSTKIRRIGGAVIESDDRESLSLKRYVDESVDRLSADYPDVTFNHQLEGPIRIHAGPAVEMAVEELIENAAEHNVADDPWVRVDGVTREPDVSLRNSVHTNLVGIRITDNGPGIPEQERAVIADDAEVSPLNHSDGVGLWSAAWILQGYDGEIRIQERTPTGTIVEVLLPPGEE